MIDHAITRDYAVTITLPNGDRMTAADLIVETDRRGRHLRSGLRYRNDWLTHSQAYALNPVHAPLTAEPIEWRTREVPAILDEVMPGRWARTVMQRAWELSGIHLDVADLHAVLGEGSRRPGIGAVGIQPPGTRDDPPPSPPGFDDLERLAIETDRLIAHENTDLEVLRRLQAGSSAGGARPKVLVAGDHTAWLAKYPRRNDPFNHVIGEYTCLQLAARAGIPVPESRIFRAGNMKALLVRRFDMTHAGGRSTSCRPTRFSSVRKIRLTPCIRPMRISPA